ncbi:MAG: hypothetical protein AB7G68_16485 [Nitrospiraceae bacterium]
MTYDEYLKQAFAQQVLGPLRWINSAWRLMEAAEYLTKDIHRFWQASDQLDEQPVSISVLVGSGYQPIFMMLYGFAIENLCKAYMVTRLDENDRKKLEQGKLPERLKGNHDLLRFVEKDIQLELDIDERELVKRLQSAVRWAGRYPVSTGPRSGDEGVTMPQGIMSYDVPRTQNLAERIQTHVIAMLHMLHMKVSVHSPHRRVSPGNDAMRWTADTPTTPGFYWNRGPGGRTRIFELRDEGRGLFIVQTGKPLADVEPDHYEWAGPLAQPDDRGRPRPDGG